MQFRGFHCSAVLRRRWTETCDSLLLENYEKFGPSWQLVARETKRNASECRKRWLSLSGILEKERYEADRQLWLDGYERSGEGWIRVPIDELPTEPLERLAKHCPPPFHKSDWQKKMAGWKESEFLLLREGYEQHILPLGPEADEESLRSAWQKIASKLSRRTADQCRNFFQRQHVMWRAETKLSELQESS